MLLQSCAYPNFWEGADRVSGQLHRNKGCPFSGLTRSGRVWRKVPESEAWSVDQPLHWAPQNLSLKDSSLARRVPGDLSLVFLLIGGLTVKRNVHI